jgi:hypothetical protein
VRGWLSLRRGGGVVTYQGFRMMIENAFATRKTSGKGERVFDELMIKYLLARRAKG